MSSTASRIRSSLRKEILDGHLMAGEAIPERAVAERLDVSRVPLREALIQLERDGLVQIVAKRGAFVRSFSAHELKDLYEARQAVEGMASRLAAVRMDPEALVEFDATYNGILNNTDEVCLRPKEMGELGVAFHSAIIEGSGNETLLRTALTLSDQLRLSRRLSYERSSAEWRWKTAQEHLGISKSIQDRDQDLAEHLMRTHIAEASLYFRASLDFSSNAIQDRTDSTPEVSAEGG